MVQIRPMGMPMNHWLVGVDVRMRAPCRQGVSVRVMPIVMPVLMLMGDLDMLVNMSVLVPKQQDDRTGQDHGRRSLKNRQGLIQPQYG